MLDHELEDCYQSCVDVAKEVGKIIRDAFYQEKKVDLKAGMADLVTETDQLVEKIIISTLKEKYPTHSFIGEESIAAGQKCELTDNPTWVIDPIDGTTNFVHRFPFTAVSIGFLIKKESVMGLVYNPILDELYTAKKGQGSFCNGKRLQVSNTEDLGKALLCAEFGSSRDKDILDLKFRTMRNVIEKAHGAREIGSMACALCQVASGNVDAFFHDGFSLWDSSAGYLIILEAGGIVCDLNGWGTEQALHCDSGIKDNLTSIRSLGSAAMDMCKVASGSLDAYFEQGIHCWDIAAGDLIVREAGGVVYDLQGGPLDLMSRRLLCAGTEKLAKQIAQFMEPIDYERD